MSWLDGLRHKLRVVLRPADYDRELDDEFRFHQELDAMQVNDHDEARRRFGNRTIHKEETRATTWLAWFDLLRQDTSYAWRSIRRAPGATAMIVITLALGIGVNATTFSLMDQLFLRNPDGIADPGAVRRVWATHSRGEAGAMSYGDTFTWSQYRAVADASGTPDRFAATYMMSGYHLGGTRRGTPTNLVLATGNYFNLLGVHPAIGRFFTVEEARPGTVQKLLVLSHAYWRAQFAGDSNAVGRTIKLDTSEWQVIGVAPEGFSGTELEPADVWAPVSTYPGAENVAGTTIWESPRMLIFRTFSRLPATTQVADFERKATGMVREVNVRMSARNADTLMRVSLAPIIRARGPDADRQEATIIKRLQAVAFIVLIIACANVVNLLLSRAVMRRREIAVRLALGISRNRLIRLITIEAMILAMVAAAASLLAASWGGAVLRATLMADIHWAHPALGAHVIWATIAAAVGCGLIAGIIPAVQYSRPELTADLKDGGRGSVRTRSRLRDALVIAQAALSVTLLVGAALLVRTMQNVDGINTGYDADRILYGRVEFEPGQAPSKDVWEQTIAGVESGLRSRPGIEAVARTGTRPFAGISYWNFWWGSDSIRSLQKKKPFGYAVTPPFFAVTGIRVLSGTVFQEGAAGASQVMVNAELAQTLWPGVDAVGQCMRFEKSDAPCSVVTGVVSNAGRTDLIEAAMPMFYLPLGNAITKGDVGWELVVRTRLGSEAAAAREMAALIKQAFPAGEPNVRPMSADTERLYRPWRLGAQLFTGVGVLALLVALVGIYSTVSYSVGQRAHEFGVRAALGAKLSDVLNQVVGEGVRVVAIGIAFGMVLSMVAGRFVRALLYGVEPTDVSAMILAGSTLLLVTIAAAIVPAWRAARADPVHALRGE